MARILVLFSTFDGQTARIAERIGAALAAAGHVATVKPADDPGVWRAIGEHDAVIVGGAIHRGRHARILEKGTRANAAALAAHPNAFFSVSLSAAGTPDQVANARACVDDFCKRTGWHPRAIALFGGALLYRKYNPLLRMLMRFIARAAGGDTDTSRDYEYTDWQAVERFASRFASQVELAAVAAD
jgi:menaquinone-dependent protoporphyrinogen oxidase